MVRKLILLSTALFVVGLMTTAAFACGNCNGKTQHADMQDGASAAQCPYLNMLKANNANATDGAVQPAVQTTPMPDGNCNGQCPMHAKNASGECTMKAGETAAAAATADSKDADCSGKCDQTMKAGAKCNMKAGAKCTMKAGETKEAAATATSDDAKATTKTDAKAADELPKGIIEGNVYTLADGTKRFVCPVMSSHMNVADAKDHYDFEGKRYYLCCAGCIDKMTADPKVYIDALVLPANIVRMDGKKEVFVCPVSKEEGKVSAKSLFVDNGGKRYYMCCEHCPPKFKADPAKFMPKAEAPATDKTKS